jgi:putative transposase
MKKSKFIERQIAFALPQAESGTHVPETRQEKGISEGRCYRWKHLCGGLMPSKVKKLRYLEDEKAQPRQVVADPRERGTFPRTSRCPRR